MVTDTLLETALIPKISIVGRTPRRIAEKIIDRARAQRRFLQPRGVPPRRRAEQPPVLAAELGGTVIADGVAYRGHVARTGQQLGPRFLQPDLLLVLDRRQ